MVIPVYNELSAQRIRYRNQVGLDFMSSTASGGENLSLSGRKSPRTIDLLSTDEVIRLNSALKIIVHTFQEKF